MLVLERGLGWGGTEGCAGMLAQMNTDDDKDIEAEYIQGPRFRSSKQLLRIAQKKK
jgi:hypothetical protein